MPTKAPRSQIVLAYDLGGTKVAVGAVDHRGKILCEITEPVALARGKRAVMNQLIRLGQEILAEFPTIRRCGVASAGPLDPTTGVLLDPTNFSRGGKAWGKVPLGKILSRGLKIPVSVDNDAAAAVLAEHWLGRAKTFDNVMVLTLGTGLGTGMICNGKLLRSGRYLHPEAGHIILRAGDRTARCGCGNWGCAEAYLSGSGFTRRARAALGQPSLTTHEIARRAKAGKKAEKKLFSEYAENMAIALHNYVTLFSPELVILTGGFAETSPLFLNETRRLLKKLLRRRRGGIDLLPRVAVSSLDNRAGLIGGALIGGVGKKNL